MEIELIRYEGGRRKKNKTWRIIKYILYILIAIFFIGYLLQSLNIYRERRIYSAPGKLIEVNSHKMHIYTCGKESPAIVFTSDINTPSSYIDFYNFYRKLSKNNRVIAYDRLGFGWSEETDVERTIDKVTSELGILLRKSGQKPPYIFVAHSSGYLEAVRFAQMHPDQVAGILIIAGNTDKYLKKTTIPMYNVMKFARSTGILRLLSKTKTIQPPNQTELLPEVLQKTNISQYLKTSYNKSRINEIKELKSNMNTVFSGSSLGDIPVMILTGDTASNNFEDSSQTLSKLKALSSNVRVENIHSKDEYIHSDKPESVISSINKLLEIAKRNAALKSIQQ